MEAAQVGITLNDYQRDWLKFYFTNHIQNRLEELKDGKDGVTILMLKGDIQMQEYFLEIMSMESECSFLAYNKKVTSL